MFLIRLSLKLQEWEKKRKKEKKKEKKKNLSWQKYVRVHKAEYRFR